MIKLAYSKTFDKAIFISLDEEGKQALMKLYELNIVFGMYQIWIRDGENKGINVPEIAAILSKIPNATCIAFVNIVKNFTHS